MRYRSLLGLVPVVALLATAWLPFVNQAQLWLGLPPVIVWVAGWSIATTPILVFVAHAAGADDVEPEGRQ